MTEYMVSIVVTTTNKAGESDTVSTVRKYHFGDNERWIAAGAADALRQSSKELIDGMQQGEDLLSQVTGWPVRR